jgi:selenide,water dikinase
LRPLQELFPQEEYPDLLVGLGKPDDAAVWRLDDKQALVVTTDFFTPVVDTPYEYGAIAAANALSDLYAMGAKPIFALNIAAMPANLPVEIITEILRGGAEKVREAGAAIAGGHTIQDDEPKYGLVTIGIAKQNQLITKDNARVGDLLVLTKPLGTGVTTTALKNGACATRHVDQAIHWMSKLNRKSAEIASEFGVRAGTDITGFGFLGHSVELATSSRVRLQLWLQAIPFFDGALAYAKQGHIPGGSADNKLYFSESVAFSPDIDDHKQMLLFDAQTSGGLLLALQPDKLAGFMSRAAEMDQGAWLVGEVVEGEGIQVQGSVPDIHQVSKGAFPDLMFLT